MASLAHPLRAPETIADRLGAATVAHRDAQEVATICARAWRELIIEAVDAGMRQADIAELTGISRARLHAIIVREYSRS